MVTLAMLRDRAGAALIVANLVAASVSAAHAAAPGNAALRQACMADVRVLCTRVQPGGRVLAALRRTCLPILPASCRPSASRAAGMGAQHAATPPGAHHASNAGCIDKNFGAVLVVFDRLFGTFAELPRNEPVRFGIAGAAPSVNPLRLVFAAWTLMIADVLRAKGVVAKLRVLLAPPAPPAQTAKGVE